MDIIGLITARSGSKRIPGKNRKIFCGKPLIEWTFECIKNSKAVTNWIVSTDDKKIIELSKDYPVRAPFIRPAELATDDATSFDVVKHCLNWLLNNENYQPDWIILLEPTSPTRLSFHIDEVAEILHRKSKHIDSICGVSKARGCSSAYKALKVNKKNFLIPYNDNKTFSEISIRNQLVKPSYFINSLIYGFKVERILSKSTTDLWGNLVYSYYVDTKYVSDIDNIDDWVVAEAKMNYLINNFARKLNG